MDAGDSGRCGGCSAAGGLHHCSFLRLQQAETTDHENGKEFTGRELTLGGDIDLKIGFHPTLEVQNVAFENAPWGSQPQMAQIKRFEVQVAILPLISGDIAVNRLIMVEPKFIVEINKSGKTNLDFDTPKEAEPPKAKDKPRDEGQALFELKEIEIKDGKFIYKDHQTGKTEVVDIVNLKLKAPTFGAAAGIDLKGNYNKMPFQVKGKIGQLSGILNPKEKWPLKLEAQAVKAKVSIDGNIQDPLSAQGIDLKFNVEGEVRHGNRTRKFRCQEKGRSGQQNQKFIQQTQRIDHL